ncbi:MAG TPA: thioredoxin [Thermoanaerobaculia bacterium]|nr:thioredoxin [Thermoanaerobaculia bacterium]
MRELNEGDFEGVTREGLVLVDFSAAWCGPCKVMHPVVERVAADFDGTVSCYMVDIDQSPSLAARNGVMSVPTFLLFKDGQPVERLVGAVPERELRKRIEQHLAGRE